jgi:hypothetical protein
MIKEIFLRIFKKSEFLEVENFLNGIGSFEEIPIISRYKDGLFFEKYVERDGISFLLINAAIFYINNVYAFARKSMPESEYSNLFMCITLCNLEEDFKETGFVIPNVFITRTRHLVNFLGEGTRVKVANIPILSEEYGEMIDLNCFDIHQTFSNSANLQTVRYYLVFGIGKKFILS